MVMKSHLDKTPIELLGPDILHQVIEFCDQNDLVALSQSCKTLRQEANKKLYRNIIAVDSEVSLPTGTVLKSNKLESFVRWLDRSRYENMRTMLVHFQSGIEQYDYSALYDKLGRLMEISKHRIYFQNYDVENLRNNYSLTQYLMMESTSYVEQADETLEFFWKNNNVSLLNNWILFECQELSYLPYNPQLEDLDLNFGVILSAESESLVNTMTRKTLSHLKGLSLNTPSATMLLLKTLKESIFLESLERLSLTAAHSLKQNSEVLYGDLREVCDLDSVKSFEFNASCIHHGCDCISRFFKDWFSNKNEKQLTNLNLINYKFNNSKNNLQSFQSLLCSNVLHLRFPYLRELVIDISDYDNLGKANFKLSKLMNNIYSFRNLERLVIPDFLNSWAYDLPSFMNKSNVSYFDLLLNQCSCQDCSHARNLFVHGSDPVLPSSNSSQSGIVRIEHTETNVKYLGFIASVLKSSFSCINQNLFSINSSLNLHSKPLDKNKSMDSFTHLMLHSVLREVFDKIKFQSPKIRQINLGGIQKKYII